MKRSLFLILPMLFASVAIFGQGTTPSLADSPCNEYYEAAIKFIVDTPVVHPFTVGAAGTKVTMAPGNLQYQAKTDTWRFALNQYDVCGDGKGITAIDPTTGAITLSGAMTANVYWDSLKADGTHQKVLSNNLLASKNYEGWIDVFGWGTSGHGAKAGDSLACNFAPWSTSQGTVNATYNAYGYGPSYAATQRATLNPSMSNNIDTLSKLNRYFDWGYYNNIREYSKCSHNEEGTSAHQRDSTMYFAGVWRTPTQDEWFYILRDRRGVDNQTANPPIAYAKIKYGTAARDTIRGFLIFPDDYRSAEAGVPKYTFGRFNTSAQPVTLDILTWEAMEDAGVVFLPYAGYRSGNSVGTVGSSGYCWTSTAASAMYPRCLDFGAGGIKMNMGARSLAISVRLVQDIKE